MNPGLPPAESVTTPEKALRINVDAARFGTFAEIGAGQEVARWFFHVGRAAGTIAKAISAYDMAVSDELYGPTDRYVSRKRLQSMLTCEFEQLQKRSSKSERPPGALFVFADTVATRSHSHRDGGHGWMGVRFQTQPGEEVSEIIIHVKMLDSEAVQEQETVGIVGVNLTYGAFYLSRTRKR